MRQGLLSIRCGGKGFHIFVLVAPYFLLSCSVLPFMSTVKNVFVSSPVEHQKGPREGHSILQRVGTLFATCCHACPWQGVQYLSEKRKASRRMVYTVAAGSGDACMPETLQSKGRMRAPFHVGFAVDRIMMHACTHVRATGCGQATCCQYYGHQLPAEQWLLAELLFNAC